MTNFETGGNSVCFNNISKFRSTCTIVTEVEAKPVRKTNKKTNMPFLSPNKIRLYC